MLRVNPALALSDLRETQSGAGEHFETVILDHADPIIIDRGIVASAPSVTWLPRSSLAEAWIETSMGLEGPCDRLGLFCDDHEIGTGSAVGL